VGNPQDAAWKNIGKNPSTAMGARPIRQGGLTGYSWKDIPGVISNDPNLPAGVDPTFLPANGHNHGDFTKNMSYLWGVIWYLYQLQVATAWGAWRLGDCIPSKLIDGAKAYNWGSTTYQGEGVPDYDVKIKEALKMICCGSEFGL
jgi:hypothetical protein